MTADTVRITDREPWGTSTVVMGWVVLSYRRCRSGRAASDPEASNLEQVLVQITSAGPLPKTVPGSVPVVLPGHRDSAPSRYRDVPSSVPLRSVHGGIPGG